MHQNDALSRADEVSRWQQAAEEAEKLCLEQMELTRQAQQAEREASETVRIQRETIASQQSELAELRRNLDRSTTLIATLEQRLRNLQGVLDRQQERHADRQIAELEAQVAALGARAEQEAAGARSANQELERAAERQVLLERQVMQLRALLERTAWSVNEPTLNPTTEPTVTTGWSRVQLPPFLNGG